MTKAELLQIISEALEEDRRTDPRELYQRWVDAGLTEGGDDQQARRKDQERVEVPEVWRNPVLLRPGEEAEEMLSALQRRYEESGVTTEGEAMKLNDKWWYDRADIPNQSGFRLILRLKGNETRLDKVVLCPDGCYRLATTDIDKVEGWLPVEVPSLSLGRSGLKFHPGS